MSEIASATHPPTLGPQIGAGLGTPEGRGHNICSRRRAFNEKRNPVIMLYEICILQNVTK